MSFVLYSEWKLDPTWIHLIEIKMDKKSINDDLDFHQKSHETVCCFRMS